LQFFAIEEKKTTNKNEAKKEIKNLLGKEDCERITAEEQAP
jgi:hypothetical protein